MGFSRQETWSGLPCPSPENLPDPGIEPISPPLAGRFLLPLSHLGSQSIRLDILVWTSFLISVYCQLNIVMDISFCKNDIAIFLTFNRGWKSWRRKSEMRHSVLWKNLAEWTFRELDIFWRGFYEPDCSHLLISTKVLKIMNGDSSPSWLGLTFLWLGENLYQIVCLTAHIPLHQNHIYTDLPSRAVPQSSLRGCLLG